MQIIAHRGASALKPENTIEAFKTAHKMGSNFFETDVQLTKDGILVLAHDFEINGKPVKETCFSQTNLHRLTELLDILSPLTKLNIEIKNEGGIYPGIEQKVLNTVYGYGEKLKQRILISSFDYPTLKEVRRLDAGIKIAVLTKDFKLQQALDIAAFSVNMSTRRINKEIVEECHKNGLKVFVYTVNDYLQALAMQEMGADGLFSDYPDLLERK
jgi:glycerophosphoryl diester phosphodiesterase